MRGAEALGLLELVIRDVHGDDRARTGGDGPVDRVEADSTRTDDDDRVAGFVLAVLMTAPAPVTTPQPSSAAWGKGTASLTFTSWFSWMRACCAKPPRPKACATG